MSATNELRTTVFYAGTHLSRPDYEALCADLGVTPANDSELGDYADEHGNFGMAHYDRTDAATISKAARQCRWFALKRETPPAPAPAQEVPSVPAPEGQLWEECERCGKEPCYMPLMLCLGCWPK